AVDDPALKASLRQHLSDGLVFPKARQLALLQVFGDDCAAVLNEPNNILGVEYIKWLLRLNSPIAPVTITRTGATHESDESCAGIASASLIRKRMLAGGSWQSLVPSQAAGLYENELSQGYAPRSLAPLERAILARLRTISQAELLTLPDVTEGLEGRIYKAARTASSLDELYQLIKSKRYTLSRIRRIILCAYLGIPSDLQTRTPPYIRVLGLNERGRQILSRAKETAALTFSTSLAKLEGLCADASRFAGIEAAATDVFSLCAPKIMPCGLDFTAEAVIIK
ncbi:MAG: nucleotidyltransferase family protein, partial [Acetanaerobacterium sp.]